MGSKNYNAIDDDCSSFVDADPSIQKEKESAEDAVFPCVVSIMPNCVIRKKDPIFVTVKVLEGILKV